MEMQIRRTRNPSFAQTCTKYIQIIIRMCPQDPDANLDLNFKLTNMKRVASVRDMLNFGFCANPLEIIPLPCLRGVPIKPILAYL